MRWPNWWPPDRHNATVVWTTTALFSVIAGLLLGEFLHDRAVNFEKYQTTAAALIALTAACAAWIATHRTLRFNIMKHEEERIVRRIPGLRQADRISEALSRLVRLAQRPERAIDLVEGMFPDLKAPSPKSIEQILNLKIPDTDDELKERVGASIERIRAESAVLKMIRKDLFVFTRRIAMLGMAKAPSAQILIEQEQYRSLLNEYDRAKADGWEPAVRELNLLHQEIQDKLAHDESRLLNVRRWIDRHFAE